MNILRFGNIFRIKKLTFGVTVKLHKYWKTKTTFHASHASCTEHSSATLTSFCFRARDGFFSFLSFAFLTAVCGTIYNSNKLYGILDCMRDKCVLCLSLRRISRRSGWTETMKSDRINIDSSISIGCEKVPSKCIHTIKGHCPLYELHNHIVLELTK